MPSSSSDFTLTESKNLNVPVGKALRIIFNSSECPKDSYVGTKYSGQLTETFTALETQGLILKSLSERMTRGEGKDILIPLIDHVTKVKGNLKKQFLLNFRFFHERNGDVVDSVLMDILSGSYDKHYKFSACLILEDLINSYYCKAMLFEAEERPAFPKLIKEISTNPNLKIDFYYIRFLTDMIEKYYLQLESFVIRIGKPSILGVCVSNNFLSIAACYYRIRDICSNLVDEKLNLPRVSSINEKINSMHANMKASIFTILNTLSDWFAIKRPFYSKFLKPIIFLKQVDVGDSFYFDLCNSLIERQHENEDQIERLIDNAQRDLKNLGAEATNSCLNSLVILFGRFSRLSVKSEYVWTLYSEKLVHLAKNLILSDHELLSQWGHTLWSDSRLGSARDGIHEFLYNEIWILLSEKKYIRNRNYLFSVMMEIEGEYGIESGAFERLKNRDNSTLMGNIVSYIRFCIGEERIDTKVEQEDMKVKQEDTKVKQKDMIGRICLLFQEMLSLESMEAFEELVALVPAERLIAVIVDKLNGFGDFLVFSLFNHSDWMGLIFGTFASVCDSKIGVEAFYSALGQWAKAVNRDSYDGIGWLPGFVDRVLEGLYMHPDSCEWVKLISCLSPLFSRAPRLIFNNVCEKLSGRMNKIQNIEVLDGFSRGEVEHLLFVELAPLLVLNTLNSLTDPFDEYGTTNLCEMQKMLLEIVYNQPEFPQIQKLAAEILGRLLFVTPPDSNQITPIFDLTVDFLKHFPSIDSSLEDEEKEWITAKTLVYTFCNSVAFFQTKIDPYLGRLFCSILNVLAHPAPSDSAKKLMLGCVDLVALIIKCQILNSSHLGPECSLYNFHIHLADVLFSLQVNEHARNHISNAFSACFRMLEKSEKKTFVQKIFPQLIIRMRRSCVENALATGCTRSLYVIYSIIFEDRDASVGQDIVIELVDLMCSLLTERETVPADPIMKVLGCIMEMFPSVFIESDLLARVQGALKRAQGRKDLSATTKCLLVIINDALLNNSFSSQLSR